MSSATSLSLSEDTFTLRQRKDRKTGVSTTKMLSKSHCNNKTKQKRYILKKDSPQMYEQWMKIFFEGNASV